MADGVDLGAGGGDPVTLLCCATEPTLRPHLARCAKIPCYQRNYTAVRYASVVDVTFESDPVTLHASWDAWGRSIAESGAGRASRALRDVAGEVRDKVRGATDIHEAWAGVGVRVVVRRLHGRSGAIGPGRSVYVMEGEPGARHEWVAAHEVGHLLIDAARRAGLFGLRLDAEEAACDAFAAEVTGVPKPPLAVAAASVGG